MNPLISVVIPSYNHVDYIGKAIQSVIDQTYTNWEIIIVDNHSDDSTDDVVNSFNEPRLRLLKIHNNGIIAASRNMGIDVAKGEWIAFLDSDDWWERNKLQVCLDNAEKNTALIYHDLRIINPDGNNVESRKTILRNRNIRKGRHLKKPVLMDLLVNGNPIANSSVVTKKSFLKKICGLNESREMVAAEDYNAWMKIADLTDAFVYIPKALGFYLMHDKGVSQSGTELPAYNARAEFESRLSDAQLIWIQVARRYSNAREALLSGDLRKAKRDFGYSIKNGDLTIRIKSIIMLIYIVFKNTLRN